MTIEDRGLAGVPVQAEISAFDYAKLVFASALWGGGVVASKLATAALPSFTAAGLRTAIASLVFLPLILLVDRDRPRLDRRDLRLFFLLGAFGFFGFNAIYFIALKHSTASHSALVTGAGPILTALLSVALISERLGAGKLVGIGISTLGVAVVVASSAGGLGGEATVLGDVLLIAAQVVWVLYTIYSRFAMQRFSPIAVTGYSCFFGAALLAPLAALTDFSLPVLQAAPAGVWLAIGYSSTASMVLAYVLWNVGVKKIGATRTAVFTNLTPIWGVLLSAPIAGETIGIYHVIAGVLIIGGVWLTNRR